MTRSVSRTRILSAFAALFLFCASDAAAVGVSLKGSPESVLRQNHVAKAEGYTFVGTPDEVEDLVTAGELVPVHGNSYYDVLEAVSFKYARPEMRLFIERLAEQYFDGTGEQLVVTSLTRPLSTQPRNAHPLSVHPTGIAVDLRVSDNGRARAWLEAVLLKLERQGLLDITRERYPPHYHVALFPDKYRAHLEDLIGPSALALALTWEAPQEEEEASFHPIDLAVANRLIDRAGAAPRPSMRALGGLAMLTLILLPLLLWRRNVQERTSAPRESGSTPPDVRPGQ